MKREDRKIEKTINNAYNFLLRLDDNTLNHYYSNSEKEKEIIETLRSVYESSKLPLGFISGGFLGTVMTDLMNKDLDTPQAMISGMLAGLGAFAVLVCMEGVGSSIKVNLDYAKNKKKFKDASEIVKMADKVDDEIVSKVMTIDAENIKKARFKK